MPSPQSGHPLAIGTYGKPNGRDTIDPRHSEIGDGLREKSEEPAFTAQEATLM
jgi:hypothetical protein